MVGDSGKKLFVGPPLSRIRQQWVSQTQMARVSEFLPAIST